jgi:hypothetical protein
MKKYTDTVVYKNIICEITNKVRFNGFDENDEPVYNKFAVLPKVYAFGTVKAHGTNAGVGYNFNTKEIWPLKRSGVMKEWTGHMGFNEWVYKNLEFWRSYFEQLPIVEGYENVVVYGEWMGGNIQKKVALNQIEKTFMAFNVYVFEIHNNIKDIRLNYDELEDYGWHSYLNLPLLAGNTMNALLLNK